MEKSVSFLDTYDYWKEVLSVLFLIITTFFVFYLYKKRKFLDQITYSANILKEKEDGNYLLIRTVQLMQLDDLLPKNIIFRIFFKLAVMRTSKENIFIEMNRKSMQILMPAIINGISIIFGENIIKNMLGKKTQKRTFYIGLTCEKYGSHLSQKIRVLMVSEEILSKIYNKKIDLKTIKFERPYHADRLKSLEQMAEKYTEELLSKNQTLALRKIEVYYM